MLENDPEFEKSLLNKAQKQQDLVVMSYDSDNTTKVLYEPKTNKAISLDTLGLPLIKDLI
jgi:transketolase C-terminal domain/subunit